MSAEKLPPDGFLLGPGWIPRIRMPWTCTMTGACREDARYWKGRRGDGACVAHAETMGAIVRKAEAPPQVHAFESSRFGDYCGREVDGDYCKRGRAHDVHVANKAEAPTPDVLRSMTPKELAKFKLLTDEQINEALRKGQLERQVAEGRLPASALAAAQLEQPSGNAGESTPRRNLLSELCRDLRESFRCVCDPETTDDEPCGCGGDGNDTAGGDGCWVCLANRYEEMAAEAPAAAPPEQPSRNPLQLPAKAPVGELNPGEFKCGKCGKVHVNAAGGGVTFPIKITLCQRCWDDHGKGNRARIAALEAEVASWSQKHDTLADVAKACIASAERDRDEANARASAAEWDLTEADARSDEEKRAALAESSAEIERLEAELAKADRAIADEHTLTREAEADLERFQAEAHRLECDRDRISRELDEADAHEEAQRSALVEASATIERLEAELAARLLERDGWMEAAAKSETEFAEAKARRDEYFRLCEAERIAAVADARKDERQKASAAVQAERERWREHEAFLLDVYNWTADGPLNLSSDDREKLAKLLTIKNGDPAP